MSETRRAKEIFLAALEHEGEELEAFVERECAGDAALRARVDELLAAHGRADSVLPAPGFGLAGTPGGSAAEAEALRELEPGARVGPYRLVREIGHGGFGTVWAAEQERPLKRMVALKIVKAGMDTREVVARFEAERQALALMDHPGIARVFDAGATASGRPYFAMELVDGVPVTEYCDSCGLRLRERLAIFLDICRAVQHAHQKGVIHRDLKPSNVLVAEVDGEPHVRVIDFGIAKATERDLGELTLKTREGVFIGTPAYMSPEQAGSTSDVDTRSDVYSLGVLLYELLSGSTPFDETTLGLAGMNEIQRLILEVDPPRPSTRLVQRGGATPLFPVKSVRGDLDWIVMRCLEKDRARRYDSVDAVAQEIERHLAGEPVLAGPPNLSYRMVKFVRRHRATLAALTVIVLLLVTGIVVSTTLAVRARRAERAQAEETRRAQLELGKYAGIARFMQDLLLGVDPATAQGKDTTLLRELLDRAARRADETKREPEVEATVRDALGNAYGALSLYAEAREQLERAAQLREAELGPENTETLASKNNLAAVLLRTGHNAEAEAILTPVLATCRRLLGDEHPDTLAVMGQLASALRDQHRLEEAEALLRELEAARTRQYGVEHPLTQLASNSLAFVLEALGQEDEAIERFERALEIQEATLGDEHPQTLGAMQNLASTYVDQGRSEEAEALFLRALAGKRKVYPPGHPSLIITMNALARHYAHTDRVAEAEALYREALTACLEHLGPADPHTQVTRNNLGNFLARDGRFEEAEGLLTECVAGSRALYGDDHPRTLAAIDGLAAVYLEEGRAQEALEQAQNAYERAQVVFADAPEVPAVHPARLGLCLAAVGRPEEAIGLLEAAYDGLDALSSLRSRVAETLASLYADAGDEAEAALWRGRQE